MILKHIHDLLRFLLKYQILLTSAFYSQQELVIQLPLQIPSCCQHSYCTQFLLRRWISRKEAVLHFCILLNYQAVVSLLLNGMV